MALTSKELLLIKDSIKMEQNSIRFFQGCSEITNDTQVKTLCNQMAQEHERDVNILMKHVSPESIQ